MRVGTKMLLSAAAGVVLTVGADLAIELSNGYSFHLHEDFSAEDVQNGIVDSRLEFTAGTLGGMQKQIVCKATSNGSPIQLHTWRGDGGKQIAYLLRPGKAPGSIRVDSYPAIEHWPTRDCVAAK